MCADPLKPKIKPSPSAAVVTFLLPKVGAEKCWGGGYLSKLGEEEL